MTDEEMTAAVLALSGSSDEDAASVFLSLAQSIVVARLYPYDESKEFDDVPTKHHMRTCEIAAYLLNKQGAEGETAHSENGVSRTYGAASVPDGYFDGMCPFVGVPS